MKLRRQPRSFLAFLILIASSTMSASEPFASDELTPQQRNQVDTLALKVSPDAVRKRARESFGDLRSWLRQRAPMPLSHELKRVHETHQQVLAHSRVAETPSLVLKTLARLSQALPRAMAADMGEFELFVLEREDFLSASGGRNCLYISNLTIDRTLGDAAGHDRIAFLLARQIAGSCLGHGRSWYQSEWAAAFVRSQEKEKAISAITSDDFSNTVLGRQASTAEVFSEDLFALHLCRQAGFDVQRALDVLRHEVLAKAAELPEEPGSLGSVREPLSRLRRLLMELGGLVSDDHYGLHRFTNGTWEPVPDAGLADTDRVAVFVHGLGSDLDEFDTMVRSLDVGLPESTALIGLRYPNTGSLYRSSKFLVNELTRTGVADSGVDFVCHSAGGLVFRRAAECDGLKFKTATLIGTPNSGSDLTSLRPLLEAQEFFGSLQEGLSKSMAEAIEDDSTQMVRDMEPGSLFLTELNSGSPRTVQSRYQIVRGQALSTRKSLLLALGIGTARTALRKLADSTFEESQQSSARSWIGRLRIPEEVRSGDMAVTLTSATTPDPAEVLTVSTAHTKLPDDVQVINFIRHTIDNSK
jgi:pimeloyl-ACP methyl ester carboxylesterase